MLSAICVQFRYPRGLHVRRARANRQYFRCTQRCLRVSTLRIAQVQRLRHLHADFGELELVGYNLVTKPVITASNPPIVLETYWQAGQTLRLRRS